MEKQLFYLKQFNYLKNALNFGKLHHSYIFYGPKGGDKKSFAFFLAKYLQCLNRGESAFCGECKNCKISKDGFVVDSYIIDNGDSSIKIEEVNEAKKNIVLSSMGENYRILIINNAHNLTREAREVLLKVLEEPPGKTIIILITDEKKNLPKTILSRCPSLFFKKLTTGIDIDQGLVEDISILFEKSLFDKITTIDRWAENGVSERLEGGLSILYNIFLIKNGVLVEAAPELKDLEKKIEYDKITKVMDLMLDALNKIQTNVNKRLLLENMAIKI